MLEYVLVVCTSYCDERNTAHAFKVTTYIASGDNACDLGFKGLYEAYEHRINLIKKNEFYEGDINKRTKLLEHGYMPFGKLSARAFIKFVEYGRTVNENSRSWYDHTTIDYEMVPSGKIVFNEDGHVKLDEKTQEELAENLREKWNDED